MSTLFVTASKIEEILPHPNADKLEIARIKGWFCIVGKGEHKAGDLISFLPPDSIVPQEIVDKYHLEFLKNGRRVRTLKLRGVISQGLVLPLPEGEWKEGDDLRDILKITKWEPPQTNSNSLGTRNSVSKKKKNPYFDKYTDIENIKHFNSVFKENESVVITEKIHGANFRCGYLKREAKNWFQKLFNKFFGDYEFVYGSHNVQLDWLKERHGFYKTNVYLDTVRKYDLKKKLEKDTIIYGEIYGKGIQDLTYGLDEVKLSVFDIKKEGKYLDYDSLKSFCHFYNLPLVPELYRGRFSEAILIEHSSGNSLLFPSQIREGCVVKPVNEENHPSLGRKILKSINLDYLVREKGTENK